MRQFYVGIDLGGSNVRIAICDKDNNCITTVRKKQLLRKEDVIEEVNANLINLIDNECNKQSVQIEEICGIGIAIAALFDRKTGIIQSWPNNRKWENFPIKQFLEEYYHVPVVLIDDANAAVLGEQLVGAGKGYTNLVYVTISTGIGCGIIMNDILLTGENGWAGELGHTKVAEKEVICTCGSNGCLQAVASGPAILRNYISNINYEKKRKVSLEDVAILARAGDNQAKAVFDDAGKYIGQALANLIMILDISVIILGGGVMATDELILEPIIQRVKKSIPRNRKVKIIKAGLNDMNGVIGALVLIDRYLNGTTRIQSYKLEGGENHREDRQN